MSPECSQGHLDMMSGNQMSNDSHDLKCICANAKGRFHWKTMLVKPSYHHRTESPSTMMTATFSLLWYHNPVLEHHQGGSSVQRKCIKGPAPWNRL